MKTYSYMPVKEHKPYIDMDNLGIESNLTIIRFRNQFGRQFIFGPISTVRSVNVAFATVGILLGFIWGKLL